jgi:hypothetical protein
MAEIHKFSLSYDAAEDRLAWDAEDREGGTTRMWLTQRLCRALVQAVVPMLLKTTAQALPREHETAVQSWEQAAAMADFGKVEPVRPRPQSLAGLVRTVNIRPPGEAFVLTFEFGAEGRCAIGMKLPELRQTLAVMHQLHVSAGWPLDFWPAWICEPAAGPGADIVN